MSELSPLPEDVRRMYRALFLIRRVEEEVSRIYPTDKIKSPIHLSTGQEAVSVGVCEALRPKDVVFGTHRGHALYLAKGGDLKAMIAELYGKATGCAKGKGGSMHLVDIERGVMGTTSVVGTGIPTAVGYALARRMRGEDVAAAAVFGDGAVEEGAFYESVNFAVLKELPVLFVCENNFYSVYTHLRDRQPKDDLVERARACGMPAERVEGNDVFAVREAAMEGMWSIRRGEPGPYLLECRTYRWKDHVGPDDDFDKGHRTKDEASPWLDKDPVRAAGEKLQPGERATIEAEVEAELREAFEEAEKAPFPHPGELLSDVMK